MIATVHVRNELDPVGHGWILAVKAADFKMIAESWARNPEEKKPRWSALAPETPIRDVMVGIGSSDFRGGS